MIDTESYITIIVVLVLSRIHIVCLEQFQEESCLSGCQLEQQLPCSVDSVSCSDIFYRQQIFSDTAWPGKPRDLHIKEIPPTSASTNARLNITWKLPNNVSYKAVYGFLLMLVAVGDVTGKQQCLYINMSQVIWKESHIYKNLYISCLQGIKFSHSYYLQIYSVPLSLLTQNDFAYAHFSTSNTFIEQNKPQNWSSFIKFRNVNATSGKKLTKLEINFQLAPQEYGFTNYTVGLIKYPHVYKYEQRKTVNVDITSTDTDQTVIFEVLCNGSYKIIVYPWRENVKKQCVCGTDKVNINCFSCAATETSYFNITTPREEQFLSKSIPVSNDTKNHELKTKQGYTLHITLICILIVITVGIFVIIMSLYKIYKSRYLRKEPSNLTIPSRVNDWPQPVSSSFQEIIRFSNKAESDIVLPCSLSKYDDIDQATIFVQTQNDTESKLYCKFEQCKDHSELGDDVINSCLMQDSGVPPSVITCDTDKNHTAMKGKYSYVSPDDLDEQGYV